MHGQKRHVLNFDDGQVTPTVASDEEEAMYVVKNINDKNKHRGVCVCIYICTHTHTHTQCSTKDTYHQLHRQRGARWCEVVQSGARRCKGGAKWCEVVQGWCNCTVSEF
jgi:hypothetical protein